MKLKNDDYSKASKNGGKLLTSYARMYKASKKIVDSIKKKKKKVFFSGLLHQAHEKCTIFYADFIEKN
jgi:hypothetical protein